jgi:hypothetical protein
VYQAEVAARPPADSLRGPGGSETQRSTNSWGWCLQCKAAGTAAEKSRNEDQGANQSQAIIFHCKKSITHSTVLLLRLPLLSLSRHSSVKSYVLRRKGAAARHSKGGGQGAKTTATKPHHTNFPLKHLSCVLMPRCCQGFRTTIYFGCRHLDLCNQDL